MVEPVTNSAASADTIESPVAISRRGFIALAWILIRVEPGVQLAGQHQFGAHPAAVGFRHGIDDVDGHGLVSAGSVVLGNRFFPENSCPETVREL